MKAALKWSIYIWQLFWGDGYYPYLLLLAAVYLLVFHRKKRSTRQVLVYSACVLGVFFFPITAKVIIFCIGDSVYWRVLWLLPSVPVIALAMTEFLRGRRSRLAQTLLLLLCCGVIAVSGEDMISDGNYSKVANIQKVPDDVAQICDQITAKAEADGLTDYLVLGDEYLASYLRVYNPSIQQAYGRWGRGVVNNACRHVYHLLKKEAPNYRKIAKFAKKGGCDFLVVPVPEDQTGKIERFGYTEIGIVGAYRIYQLNNAEE